MGFICKSLMTFLQHFTIVPKSEVATMCSDILWFNSGANFLAWATVCAGREHETCSRL